MKTIRSIIFTLLISLLIIPSLKAVKAYPFPIKITQPDGSVITIRLQGDESFHYKSTIDGYALIPNNKGIMTYAQQDANGNLVSTNVKATEINKRSVEEKKFIGSLKTTLTTTKSFHVSSITRSLSPAVSLGSVIQKSYPLSGTPKSLVILVNFSDKSFVTSSPQTAFTNLLNQKGYSTNGGTGSAKDYFSDNSMGVFNPQFDVVGPFTLPNNMAFYGSNTGGTAGNDTNPQQMVIDGCRLAAASGVDFSQYDTDKDGVVDNVFIYYAGYNEAEHGPANSIWPHRFALNNSNTKFNGVVVNDYACTSELRGNTGSNMCGVGTFCHEFGHVLGLDDMYNTNNDYSYNTLSFWDIMDEGPYLNLGRTPPAYSSYERFFLNWLKPTEIKETGEYVLDTLSTSNKAYLITQYGNHNLNGSSPSPVEFFMLENRQIKGWDLYLPGHGMLITHIYYNATTWANNTPNNTASAMGVDIVEADNNASTGTLDRDPFPGTYNVTSYNPTLRSGTDIRKPLSNITETNGKISFTFGAKIAAAGSFQPFSTVQGTPSTVQSFVVSGNKLNADLVIGFGTGLHFQLKRSDDPETAWAKSVTITPSSSTVASTVILVRYNPTVPSYTTTHNETITIKSGTDSGSEQAISGTSTRQIYVVPPVALEATDTAFYSFVAKWNSVSDSTKYATKYAAGYYLSVYNLSDGESSLFEGFDNGLKAPTGWTITAQNISSYSTYSGIKTPAIQFANNGEYVKTEKYEQPASGLSFYLRSLGGSNGGFVVEGLDDQSKWNKVDSIAITTSLFEKSKSYTFDATKSYNQFRFRYIKDIGSVTFDDITVKFNKQLNYFERDKWITAKSNTLIQLDTLSGLQPNTEYVYKVKASDKNTVYHYENITDFSNKITVKTLDYPIKKGLLVTKDNQGNVTAYLTSTKYNIYIYNLLGQCVRIIAPESTKVTITNLPRTQVYILKVNDRTAKVILSPKK